MNVRPILAIASGLLALQASPTAAAPSPEPPMHAETRLVSIEPPPGTRLAPGQRVAWRIYVAYEGGAARGLSWGTSLGRLTAVFLDDSGRTIAPERDPSVSVPPGKGQHAFTLSTVVPERAAALTVVLPLLAEPRSPRALTGSYASVTYPVDQPAIRLLAPSPGG